ncbi:MAG: fusion protein [Acidobacteria bacterium]|nr:fusion protein [Acidobacteriota bacterium]
MEELFAHYDETLSFVPNSLSTLARRPETLRVFSDLITVIWRTGTLPIELKPLVALVSSMAAGCRYCQAHESVDMRERGVPEEKISDVWDFESSPHFDEAERAVLRFARDASVLPNAVGPDHFDDLRRFYDDGQIVEVLTVICLFGFLNRWNDTVATELEIDPLRYATAIHEASDWNPGKHA